MGARCTSASRFAAVPVACRSRFEGEMTALAGTYISCRFELTPHLQPGIITP
jgi:hypothetical protein